MISGLYKWNECNVNKKQRRVGEGEPGSGKTAVGSLFQIPSMPLKGIMSFTNEMLARMA